MVVLSKCLTIPYSRQQCPGPSFLAANSWSVDRVPTSFNLCQPVVSQLARNTVCFQLVVGQKNWAAQEVAIFRHIAANFGQRKVWVLKILLLPFGFYKKRILVPNFSLFGRFNDNFTTAKKFGCGQLPPLLALPQVSVCLQVEWTFHRRRWRMSGSHALTGARSADWLIDRSIDLSLTDRPDTCCTAPSPLELGCIKARIERNK